MASSNAPPSERGARRAGLPIVDGRSTIRQIAPVPRPHCRDSPRPPLAHHVDEANDRRVESEVVIHHHPVVGRHKGIGPLGARADGVLDEDLRPGLEGSQELAEVGARRRGDDDSVEALEMRSVERDPLRHPRGAGSVCTRIGHRDLGSRSIEVAGVASPRRAGAEHEHRRLTALHPHHACDVEGSEVTRRRTTSTTAPWPTVPMPTQSASG